MRRRSAGQLVAFLLAVFVAAGMSLSVAQASVLIVKLTPMSEMDTSDEGCQGWPDQPRDGGMKAMACATVCAAPVLAPLPAATLMPLGEKSEPFAVLDPLLHGTGSPPDPYPPRTSDIG